MEAVDRVRAAAISAAVFACGAVLLGVEIAASRVLAPFFGNSLFVWGALIGVVLTGLAIGYAAGGGLADRIPTSALLVSVILLGSAFVLVPDYGVEQLFAVGAAVLFAAAAVVAVAERLWLPVGVAGAACAGAIVAAFVLAPESGQTLSGVAAKNWSPIFRDRARPAG